MNKYNIFRRFLIAGLSITFILSPIFAYAQTVADLQAKIAVLLEQIKTLQIQLSQLQNGTTAAFCHTFNTNLRIGDSSDEVGMLLNVLVKEGVALERSSN